METRLVQINSWQARHLDPQETTTNFGIHLKNSVTEFVNGSIHGLSLETVGFMNLVPNVREGRNALDYVLNGVNETLFLPESFYTLEQFVVALNTEFDVIPTLPPGTLVASIVEGAAPGGKDALGLAYTGVVPLTLVGNHHDLPYNMGLYEDVVWDGVGPYEPTVLRTNLQGEHALSLHSDTIVGSRRSVNGFGDSSSAIATLPINVPYGTLQVTDFNAGQNRPTVSHGPMTVTQLSNVDLAIRYLDGELVDLDKTPIFVTVRAWFHNK